MGLQRIWSSRTERPARSKTSMQGIIPTLSHASMTSLQVEFFQGPHAIKNPDLVVAGGASSGAVDGIGQLYTWGQIKKVGESQVRRHDLSCVADVVWKVRPHAEHNLGGWRVRSLSFGNESFAISCDGNKEPRRPWVEGCESIPHVITWGTSKYGELGYGGSKKSSANPDIVSSLTGFTVKKVGRERRFRRTPHPVGTGCCRCGTHLLSAGQGRRRVFLSCV